MPLDVLGDPVRLRVVRRLSERGPATLAQLAEAADVHANTLRRHLSALEAAGALVRDDQAPSGRGRPAIRYRLADEWRMPGADLRELAEMLAALVERLDPDVEQVEAFGREWGRFLAGRPGRRELAPALPGALARLGFHARVQEDRVLLSSCPCPLVAPDRPELLCTLAVAVIDGMAGVGAQVTGSAHDPGRRLCSATLGPASRGPVRAARRRRSSGEPR